MIPLQCPHPVPEKASKVSMHQDLPRYALYTMHTDKYVDHYINERQTYTDLSLQWHVLKVLAFLKSFISLSSSSKNFFFTVHRNESRVSSFIQCCLAKDNKCHQTGLTKADTSVNRSTVGGVSSENAWNDFWRHFCRWLLFNIHFLALPCSFVHESKQGISKSYLCKTGRKFDRSITSS